MHVRRFSDVPGFLDHAGDFLRAHEARHNVILGLCSQLLADPAAVGEPPYLSCVDGPDGVVAAAFRTPPHNLLLSVTEKLEACDLLAADVAEAFDSLPGVVGPVEAADRFAQAWRGRTGARDAGVRRQRLFVAERVVAPPPAPGRMRPYVDRDRDLVVAWFDEFLREALSESVERPHIERMLDRRLAEPGGGVTLWDDGGTASLAAYGGMTPNSVRIGPVYTPPAQRGRGYATALVAALTQELLDGGRRFCSLYTDLANPTSNSIYQRIGYRAAGGVDERRFEPPA
jgi:predicted GNAT family acetyltransferase